MESGDVNAEAGPIGNQDLDERVIAVLGGTNGIGRAAVLDLVANGASVVFQGRDRARAEALLASLPAGRAEFIAADLYSYADVDHLIRLAFERFGRLDGVVASGGSFDPRPKPFIDMTPEELPVYFETRLYHRLNAIHSAFNRMRDQGYGKIITLTSDAGRVATPAESMIGGAGAALIFITRALAREFAPYGIRINTVSISLTSDTPSWVRQQEKLAESSSDVIVEAYRKLEQRAAFGVCEPRDIAPLVTYLCSPRSDKLSGATISINGGMSFPSY
jgi:2-hydroxycyclohexanecarboxyl-CoA dehydrogenase